jgi:CheY-like chemotaxis protein
MQILVIEDDASIRDMLSECLSDEGYSVATASDGRQGLNMLRAGAVAPGLILLDLAMPVMSGWELLDILQGDQDLAAIPLVVLSADSSVTKQPLIGAGTPVVAKPVDLDVLLDVVASHARGG